MNCVELDLLLCDYIDGTLDAARKAAVEEHVARCAACAELAKDAAAALAFIERVPAVEPPPQLITRILFDISAEREKIGNRRSSVRSMLSRLVEPVLQPRFAMGMAMTILSFSMLGRFAGINVRQLQASDLEPAKVWAAVDDRMHRGWTRAVKFYESLRLVYEVRSRLRELTEAETEPPNNAAPADAQRNEGPGPNQAPQQPDRAR
jgi:Putative zinc-finger